MGSSVEGGETSFHDVGRRTFACHQRGSPLVYIPTSFASRRRRYEAALVRIEGVNAEVGNSDSARVTLGKLPEL